MESSPPQADGKYSIVSLRRINVENPPQAGTLKFCILQRSLSVLVAGTKEILNRLSRVSFVVALTGSGVSQESGITTFRDAQTGLWANTNTPPVSDYALLGKAGEILPEIVSFFKNTR
ncbi:MAG TPA: Sir2 family NAD-dependent protein deacetylase [Candidatus Hypogeohydataceae bacterium YC41]